MILHQRTHNILTPGAGDNLLVAAVGIGMPQCSRAAYVIKLPLPLLHAFGWGTAQRPKEPQTGWRTVSIAPER